MMMVSQQSESATCAIGRSGVTNAVSAVGPAIRIPPLALGTP